MRLGAPIYEDQYNDPASWAAAGTPTTVFPVDPARLDARPQHHQRHMNPAFVEELFVPVQFHAVIAEHKNDRVLVDAGVLELLDQIPSPRIHGRYQLVVAFPIFEHVVFQRLKVRGFLFSAL